MTHVNHSSARIVRRSRRAFTLLELVLAMSIGSLVVVGAFGIFSLMRSAEQRTEQRAEAAINMAELHNSLQKSLSSIVVVVKPRTTARAPGAQAGGGAAGDKSPAGAGVAGKEQDGEKEKASGDDAVLSGPPRLNLVTPEAGLQRLEMMVAQPPLAVKMPEGFTGFGTPELGGGVWAAIEFRRDESTGFITAWWRVFREQVDPAREERSVRRPKGARERLQERIDAREGNRPENGGGDAKSDGAEEEEIEEEARPLVLELAGERVIADGFVNVDIAFKATREDPDRPGEAGRLMDVKNLMARTADELPAYVVVEVEHKDGLRGQWTFECVYVQSRATRPMADPTEVARRREEGSSGDKGGASGAGATGGGSKPATGGSGGTGGGGGGRTGGAGMQGKNGQ